MCDGEADRWRRLSVENSELQSELEAVHTEHAQKLGRVQQEQRELEQRLEQLQHTYKHCTCQSQEEQYTTQVQDTHTHTRFKVVNVYLSASML